MGVDGEASATGELLVTGRSDDNGVIHRAEAGGVERSHVEDVDTLHLSENLETLKTGSLLEIGRDGTGSGARTDKVLLSLDLCWWTLSAHMVVTMGRPRLWAIEAINGEAVAVERTIQDLVRADLLLGSASEGSSLLARGSGLGDIACGISEKSQVSHHTTIAIGGTRGAKCVRRTKEVVKDRATMGETATRRAAVMAERDRNMLDMMFLGPSN